MSSSLGYPFAPAGPRSHSGLTVVGNLASSATSLVLSTATFPWQLFIKWLSWFSGFALRSMTSLGVPTPAGYIPAEKLTELNSILNHMHAREDLYRRAIKELQEELDSKDSDRKKALRKLKATKEEISNLTEQLAELQAIYEAGVAAGGLDPTSEQNMDGEYRSLQEGRITMRNVIVHIAVIAAATSVWQFSHFDHSALHWKLVFSMFFPLLWFYVSWLTGDRQSRATRPPLVLLSAAWFLVGFAVALSLDPGPHLHSSYG